MKVEKKAKGQDFLDKYGFTIVIGILVCISLWMRVVLTGRMHSGDYNTYYEKWVLIYRDLGVARGLTWEIGDYYVPYNVCIALLAQLPFEPDVLLTAFSCVFEYLSCYFIYKIAMELCSGRNFSKRKGLENNNMPKRYHRQLSVFLAVATLFLPCVFSNSATWQQCDSIYTFFSLAALYYLLKEKYSVAFIAYGISFCFKLQAIFLLPLFVLLYIVDKKFSIFNFLWIPVSYLVLGLPAIIAGRPALDVYSIYIEQTAEYGTMAFNTVNGYNLISDQYQLYHKPAFLMTTMLFVAAAVWCCRYRNHMDSRRILYVTIWILWTCAMFLPAMHERYNYMLLLLLPVYYAVVDRRKLWIGLLVNLITYMTYMSYLYGWNAAPYWTMAIPMCLMYLYVMADVMRQVRGTSKV